MRYVDRELMLLPERRRRIAEDYLSFLRSKPCLLCDRGGTVPHHLVSRKWREPTRDDFLCLPACSRCHAEIHSLGLARVLERHGMQMQYLIAAVADLLVEYFGEYPMKSHAPF
jgi:hypothetical protein